MDNNIDQLRTEVDEIKNSLSNLKNNINLSESEKKTQADLLKAQAETTKTKIEQEISALENQTDAAAQQKLEEAKTLLQSFNDIMALYESINSGSTNPPAAQQPLNENKNIFVKAKNWIGNQWYDVWDKSKWKSETGSNLLRTAGFVATGVGAGALIYKGFKELFGKEARERRKKKKEEKRKQKEKEKAERAAAEEDDEEEETTSKKKKKKKKAFWDRWYGKALKWGAIIGGSYLGIKWLGKKLDLWGVDKDNPTDDESSEVKYEAFDKLPEDKKEIYNKLGDKVDQVYEKINKRELDAGYNDEITMDRTAREVGGNTENTGVIPFCLDNKFGSVEELLGQNHSLSMALQGKLRDMIKWLQDAGGNLLENFARHYLSQFGFKPLNLVGDKLAQAVQERAQGNADREREIRLFFRQSIRIEEYFFEKKKQLEHKLASENGLGKTEKEVMNDDELYESIIGNDLDYKSFMTGGIDAAIMVLEKYNLLDGNVSDSTQELVSRIDSQRDAITGNSDNDIVKQIYEKNEGEGIDSNERMRLAEACKKMQEDIGETITPALEHNSFRIIQNLLKESDDENIKDYINKGGLNTQLKDCGKAIGAIGNNINKLSDDEIKKAATDLNKFLALKKEILLGAKTIGSEDVGLGFKLMQFVGGSFNQLIGGFGKILEGKLGDGALDVICAMPGSLLGAGGIMVTVGGVTYILGGRKTGKTMLKIGVKSIGATVYLPYVLGKYGCRGASSLYNWVRGNYMPPDLSNPEVMTKFKNDIKSGEKTLSEASDDIIHNLIKNDEKAAALIAEFDLDKGLVQSDPLHIKKKLLDKVGDAETLREIKKNKQLYEKVVKYYDSCAEVKQVVKGEGNISELELAIDRYEQHIIEQERTPKGFSEDCKNAWRDSQLKNEFDCERNPLERERAGCLDDINRQEQQLDAELKKSPNSQSQSKIDKYRKRISDKRTQLNNIDSKLSKLDNFEKELKTTMTELADETAIKNLLGEYEEIIKQFKLHGSRTTSSMSEVIDQVKCVIKLGELERPNGGGKYFKDLEDILTNLIPTSNIANNPRCMAHILSEHPELNADASNFRRLAKNISEMKASRWASGADDGLKYSAKVLQKLVKVVRRLPR